jgi:hypoxanthine phosphoribosyltransferase
MIIGDKEFSLYLDKKKIQVEVKRMATEISRDLAGKEAVFLVVLKGGFMFAADLLRQLSLPLQVSFIRASSYKGMKNTGKVLVRDKPEEISGHKTVVIVEDILDSGLTLQVLLDLMKEWKVSQVKVATLLFKTEAYGLDVKPDYTGFHIPNHFVVGYGLDYMGFGRNLPDLYMHQDG